MLESNLIKSQLVVEYVNAVGIQRNLTKIVPRNSFVYSLATSINNFLFIYCRICFTDPKTKKLCVYKNI